MDHTATWNDFQKLDIRVGRVVDVQDFPEARRPAYKLIIDFGELGVKRSSAQITDLLHEGRLVGRLVVAVVNFPPKQIATFMSEVLVLGAMDPDGVVLLAARPGSARRARPSADAAAGPTAPQAGARDRYAGFTGGGKPLTGRIRQGRTLEMLRDLTNAAGVPGFEREARQVMERIWRLGRGEPRPARQRHRPQAGHRRQPPHHAGRALG